MNLLWIWIALICINPADIPHGGIHAFNIELIFETDRESMQRTQSLLVFGEVLV